MAIFNSYVKLSEGKPRDPSNSPPPFRLQRAIDQAWDLRVWFLRHRSQPNMMKVQKQPEIPEKPGMRGTRLDG